MELLKKYKQEKIERIRIKYRLIALFLAAIIMILLGYIYWLWLAIEAIKRGV